MAEPIQRIRDLMALAEGEGEEARTAAHLAIKMMRKNGFVITVAGKTKESPAPAREQGQSSSSPSPSAKPTQWDHRKRAMVDVFKEEVVSFFRTIDVLPRDLPTDGVQLVPAKAVGRCAGPGCGKPYRVGEMVSRVRPVICARCVDRRVNG